MMFLELVGMFPEKRRNREGDWHCRCPVPRHGDGEQPEKFSLHVTRGTEGALLKCFAGCTAEEITATLGITTADLFYATPWPRSAAETNGQPSTPASAGAPSPAPALRQTASASTPREPLATLAGFAALKRIPQAFLEAEGWRDSPQGLTIPYRQRDGSPWRVRRRTSLRPGAGFRWDGQTARSLIPYGRHRLDQVMEKGELWLVEGESDAASAWLHNLPCLGLPGSLTAKALTVEDLAGIETLWIVMEPGQSGIGFAAAVRTQLQALSWQGTARLVRLPVKDLSDLHVAHVAKPEEFGRLLIAAQADAEDLFAWVDPRSPADPVPAADHVNPERALRLLSWAEMIRAPVQPIAYQWEGWTPVASVALISGAGESLKSWLALYLAVSIAAGRTALADSSAPAASNLAAGPVLYITAENSIEEEQRRCAMLRAGLALPDELPIAFIAAEGLCLGQESDFAQVVQLVTERQPAAVFIDSAIAVSGIAQENDNTQVRAFMRTRILPLARVHGATVYVIVHSPKPPTQPGARFTDEHVTRGASDWRNAADTVLYLRRDPTLGEQAVVIRHTKSRIGRRHPSIWFSLDDVDAGTAVRLTFGGTFDETSGQGETAELGKAIRATIEVLKAEPQGIYLKQLEAQVAAAASITSATFRRAAKIVRGRAPWPYGPRRGQTHAVVIEDSHGRRVFLTFDPTQSTETELPDDE